MPGVNVPSASFIEVGEDRYGEHWGSGVSHNDFKVCARDSSGILILENTFERKGGPARHLHYEQGEWFYVLE